MFGIRKIHYLIKMAVNFNFCHYFRKLSDHESSVAGRTYDHFDLLSDTEIVFMYPILASNSESF